MSLETIFGIIVAGIILLSFIGSLLPKRKPKDTHFKCSRCGTVAPHNERTIEAWRNNKNKFFCQACHAKWLQSQPQKRRENFSSRSSSGSGCLSVIVLFMLLPLAGYLLIQAYA